MTLKGRWSGLVLVCVLFAASGCGAGYRERAEALLHNPSEVPSFIEMVAPEPLSTVRLSYNSGWGRTDVPLHPDQPAWQHMVGLVCAEILVRPLLRPGDSLLVYQNVSLSLDEEQLAVYSHMPLESQVEAAGGGSGPWSDTVCWEADVRPGIHVADLTVWTSTGEEFTYSWAFRVEP